MRFGFIVGVCCVIAAAACATATKQTTPPTPTMTHAVLEPQMCGGCHAHAEEGWRASMHHASFRDRDFQRALAEDPLPFCVDCHAPRRRELGAVAESLGVDCVSCHTNAAVHEREASAGSPKTPVATARCESCHELPNPMAATMLQTTASEHEATSQYAGVTCIDCHMQRRDHQMDVTRNAGLLSNALRYSVSKSSDGNVVVSLRSNGVGHRFPTGDLFRALLVHCWIESADGRIVAETKTSLHRDWDAVRRIPGTTPREDTRLSETPIEITLPLDGSGSLVHIQVDYARGATARGDIVTMFSTLRIADWTMRLD